MPEDSDIIEKFFQEANPNPERKGCPDSETLKRLAENTLPVGHPARSHLAECSPCYREFLKLNQDHRASRLKVVQNRLRVAAALAACVGLGAVGLHYISKKLSVPVTTNISSLVRTIDLYNVGTLRGTEPNRIDNSILLPAAPLKLRVILPRFSQSGHYRVGIVPDRSGRPILAEGFGPAVIDGPRQVVTVMLNLTSAPPGLYFLLTTRGNDDASYYYPVKIN